MKGRPTPKTRNREARALAIEARAGIAREDERLKSSKRRRVDRARRLAQRRRRRLQRIQRRRR